LTYGPPPRPGTHGGGERGETRCCRYPLISKAIQQSEEIAMGDIGPERRRIEVLPHH